MQVSPGSPGTLCRAICVAPAWTGYTHMRLASEGSAQGQAQAYSWQDGCQYIQLQYIGNFPMHGALTQEFVVTHEGAIRKGGARD